LTACSTHSAGSTGSSVTEADEGLTSEQVAVCRDVTVVRAFPSQSLYGSLQDAVAAGLLHAQPVIGLPTARASSVSHAVAAKTWAPITAAMAAQRRHHVERIEKRKRELPAASKPYFFPVLQKGKSPAQCQLQAANSVAAQLAAAQLKEETMQASLEARFSKFSISKIGELTGDDAKAEPSELSPETGEVIRQGITVHRAPGNVRSSRQLRTFCTYDTLIEMALDMACSDRARGRRQTGVKAWFAFCEDVMGTPANRPMDPATTSLWEKLEDEWLAMRFVCALVQERGITPQSAYVYFSCVQGWHARQHGVKLAGGLKLERLPQMLKGLRRIIGDRPKAVRRGIAPRMLQRAMDACLDPDKPKDANIRAALATALQGLMRSAEYTSSSSSPGGVDVNKTLMRSDVSLAANSMTIMMWPCKNMHHLAGKTCPLVIGGGGTYVDADWEVRNMLAVDRVEEAARGSTPLFRDPSTNRPIAYDFMNATIKNLMLTIGEQASEYSTHSLRIGGASALFAAGANETIIRTMGRWSSDLYRLYVHACHEQCCDWSAKAGSAQMTLASVVVDEVDDY
jgi:hypothetical protein